MVKVTAVRMRKQHHIDTLPPGPKASYIINRMKGLTYQSTYSYPLVISDGYGCSIKDVDGNTYLDFTSNIGACPLGYSHPDILEAISDISKIGIHKIAGQDFYCQEHLDIAQKVESIIPNDFKTFFVNSGAEAVENAIKIAYKKMGALPGVSCTNAFHGRTLGALSFTMSKSVQKANFPELSVKRIKFCVSDNDPEIESIENLLKENKVAFILSEVIQGEGGCNVASKLFVKNLRRFADTYGVPLILDEVQTGMGRTGKWWAFENYDVIPDIMSMAKALQVGAAAYNRDGFEPQGPGVLSSTWGGGGRIDMIVGARIIDVITRDMLLQNALKIGSILKKGLKDMLDKERKIDNTVNGLGNDKENKNSTLIDVRGIGLMIGIEFGSRITRNEKLLELFKKGLLVLPSGNKSMRIMPPLILTEEEAQEGLEILNDVI